MSNLSTLYALGKIMQEEQRSRVLKSRSNWFSKKKNSISVKVRRKKNKLNKISKTSRKRNR
jgi:hypothetical protein